MLDSRWQNLSKHDQLMAISAEIMRAKVWQRKDRANFLFCLERALSLIDKTLADKKWRGQYGLPLYLREEVARFYCGLVDYDMELLYNAL